VPKRKTMRLRPDEWREVADLDQVIADLDAPEALTRAKAVRRLCPCRGGPEVYARFRGEVHRLQKDPSPLVRANALHVERDALEQEAKLSRWRAEQDRRRQTHEAARSSRRARGDPRRRARRGDDRRAR
jgi:hypothetical protein